MWRTKCNSSYNYSPFIRKDTIFLDNTTFSILLNYEQHVVIITLAYCPCAKLQKVFSVVTMLTLHAVDLGFGMLALHAVDLGFDPDYFQTIK